MPLTDIFVHLTPFFGLDTSMWFLRHGCFHCYFCYVGVAYPRPIIASNPGVTESLTRL